MSQNPPTPILVIGSGNMGVPVIASMLQKGADPSTMTIITGAAEGKTSPEATTQELLKEGVSEEAIAALTLIPRDEVSAEALPKTAMVVYATKLDKFEKVRESLGDAVKDTPILLSIAAGLDIKTLASLCPKAEIIRTMPNLTRKVQGVYADAKVSPKTYSQVTQLLGGLGKPTTLPNEDKAFNDFAVHSACGPAFIAQFMARITQEAEAQLGSIETNITAKYLKNLAHDHRNNRVRPISQEHLSFLKDRKLRVDDKAVSYNQLQGRVQQFYDTWLHVIEADLGLSAGREILNATISGTVDTLQTSKTPPEIFANQVRSSMGMTNAGLLCMGSAVPEEERFGTERQRARQNIIADNFKQKFLAEDSIIPALLAAKARGLGMGVRPQNPLHFEGEYTTMKAIKNAAEVALTPRSHSYDL
jgi:pyrroline-5-carboxylate reductase